MLAEIFDGDGTKGVETDVQRHTFDGEATQHVIREVQPGGRSCGRPRFMGVHRLVALGIGERLGDVRRQRRLAGRLAVEAEAPPPIADVLQQLDRPVLRTRAQASRGPRETFPETVLVEALEQQYLASGPLDRDAGRDDTGVVY